MSMDPLVARARELWEDLAQVPESFAPPGGVNVVVSPRSGLCPVGWVGVVALGGSAIVTAPSDSAAVIVRDALGRLFTRRSSPARGSHAEWIRRARQSGHIGWLAEEITRRYVLGGYAPEETDPLVQWVKAHLLHHRFVAAYGYKFRDVFFPAKTVRLPPPPCALAKP